MHKYLSNYFYDFIQYKIRWSKSKTRKRIAFIFSPRGSHWKKMGRQLYNESLIFRETIRRCDIVIQELLGWSLTDKYEKEVIGEDFDPFSEEEFVEPEVVALQLAISEVWRSYGIIPCAVAGLSGGEFAAAHAAGALTLRDTMVLACAVSLMIRQKKGLGKMVLVHYDSEKIQFLIEESNQTLYITAIHSPTIRIISGTNENIDRFIKTLEEKEIVHFPIPSAFAFHSPLVECWKEPLLETINDIHPLFTTTPIYSSEHIGKLNAKLDIDHWWKVLRKPALLNQTVKSLLEDGYSTFIEISPHPILTDAIWQIANDLGKKVNILPSMKRNEDQIGFIKLTLKNLQNLGYRPKLLEKPTNASATINQKHFVHNYFKKKSRQNNIIPFSLLSKKIRINPYPYYDQLRKNSPVHYFSDQGYWTVSRYNDVAYILKSPKQFSAASMAKFDSSLLGADPPDHTRVRRIVSQLFSQQHLIEIKNYIRDRSQKLIADMIQKSKWDIIDDLAGPLPLSVIMKIMGADPEFQKDFIRWSHSAVIRATGVIDTHEISGIEKDHADCNMFLQKHVQACLQQPGSSTFCNLLQEKNSEGALTEKEAIDFANLLLIAGNETTTNLIGNLFLLLLRFPKVKNHIRVNRDLIPALVEEVLRFDTPVQFVQRLVVEDVQLSGITLPRGARVLALIGSANRDSSHFQDPDQFTLDRKTKDHLAFGPGVHFCIGAQLARMQAIIVLEEFLIQLPGFKATQSLDKIERINSVQLRGPKHIWMTADHK